MITFDHFDVMHLNVLKKRIKKKCQTELCGSILFIDTINLIILKAYVSLRTYFGFNIGLLSDNLVLLCTSFDYTLKSTYYYLL